MNFGHTIDCPLQKQFDRAGAYLDRRKVLTMQALKLRSGLTYFGENNSVQL